MAVEVEVYARNMEIADNLKDYVTKKASKLDRYLNEIEHVRVDLAISSQHAVPRIVM